MLCEANSRRLSGRRREPRRCGLFERIGGLALRLRWGAAAEAAPERRQPWLLRASDPGDRRRRLVGPDGPANGNAGCQVHQLAACGHDLAVWPPAKEGELS
ncbi:MAG: hypothetical protein NT069_25070 [Planctomycetota bacterium]|nr:hypothetical protein [Planctomycetota bacterium]